MRCSLVWEIITFHTSLSLIAFSASIACPNLSHFVSPTVFSHCFSLLHIPLSIPVVTRCSSFSLPITWPKKVAWCYHILFMGDLVWTSRITVSFDFYAVFEILSILHGKHISVASNFVFNCFEIVQASHPYIRISSI